MERKDKFGEIKRRNIPFFADETEFLRFADRVTQHRYSGKIEFHLTQSVSGYDEYRLRAESGKLTIWATSGCAGGAALNAYLRRYCRYYFGILTRSGELPAILPDTKQEMAERSVFHYRYAFNYCTFGYSYAFNTWEDWERILDYLILSGYNLVLNPVGTECVWVELLEKFGYTREQALAYISAPNYLPWQWMMNLSAFESCISEEWLKEQRELSGKINQKLSDFGMSSVLPGWCGAVPDDFPERFSGESIFPQGLWCGFHRPALLLPKSDLFYAFGAQYYRLLKKMPGAQKMHYYSVDPFHEGGEKNGIDLCSYANDVLSLMKAEDENAVWALQGWNSNPDRTILATLAEEDVLVMNLHGDISPDGGDDFLGKPHIYCVVNNFGGKQDMRGSAEKTYRIPHKLAQSKVSSCIGIGMMPEGVECDELLFDIVASVAIASELPPLRVFLKEYLTARYGAADDVLVGLYEGLCQNIYKEDIVAYRHASGFLAAPSLTAKKVCYWEGEAEIGNNDFLLNAICTMLQYYDTCGTRESYRKDLVAICRQYLANESWKYIENLRTAFQSKDGKRFQETARRFLELFTLQEKIVDCDGDLNLQRYLQKAVRRGCTNVQKESFYRNAKRLITLWADSREGFQLFDYAAREYGDMLRFFYQPRWERYLKELSARLEHGEEPTQYDGFADAVSFINGSQEYSDAVSDGLQGAVNELLTLSWMR